MRTLLGIVLLFVMGWALSRLPALTAPVALADVSAEPQEENEDIEQPPLSWNEAHCAPSHYVYRVEGRTPWDPGLILIQATAAMPENFRQLLRNAKIEYDREPPILGSSIP